MDIEAMVQAWKLCESHDIARRIYHALSDVPLKVEQKYRHFSALGNGWVIGEAWPILLHSLRKYDNKKSKKGFRSFFMQTLIFRCIRAWGDEAQIYIPVNSRSKNKVQFTNIEFRDIQ